MSGRKSMTKKRSVSGLRADLAAANAEARVYLDELVSLREENARLRAELDAYHRARKIVCDVLGFTPAERISR